MGSFWVQGFICICLSTISIGCIGIKPVSMDTDPNQQRYRAVHDRIEQNDIEAFIAAHPDLDAESKESLRKGTLSRSDAQKQLKTTAH